MHKEKSSLVISTIQGKGSVSLPTQKDMQQVTTTQFISHIAKAGTPSEALVSYLLSWQVYSCYDRLAAQVAEKVILPSIPYNPILPPSSSTAKWLLSLNSDSFF